MTKPEDDSMRILKTATCKTLSGKSTLTYQIGCNTEGDIHFRIQKNSGNGFFSDEWIAWKAIQTVMERRTRHQNVTSFLLQPLFQGKSVNTPAFLLAALANEKLIKPLPGKRREHEPVDPRPFLERIDRLGSAGNKPKARPKKTAQKTTGSSTSRVTSPASRK